MLNIFPQARDNLASRLDIIGAKYVKESAVDIVSLFHQEFVMVKNSIRNKAKKRRTSLQVRTSHLGGPSRMSGQSIVWW